MDLLSEDIELHIYNQVMNGQKIESIFQELLTSISAEERHSSFANVLLELGIKLNLFQLSKTYIIDCHERTQSFFWRPILLLCKHAKMTFSAEQSVSIFLGLEQTQALEEVGGLDLKSLSPTFEKLHAFWKKRELEKVSQLKESLLQELEMAQSHRLVNEELATLAKLKIYFKHDRQVQKIVQSYLEAEANHALMQYHSSQKHVSPLSIDRPKEKSADPALLELEEWAHARAMQNVQLAYELSIMFQFLDQPKVALSLLELAPPGPQVTWRKFDLYLADRQWVSLLEHTEKMETDLKSDSEMPFAVLYGKALALWELQKKTEALAILTTLAKANPHYRDTLSLLMLWTGGENFQQK